LDNKVNEWYMQIQKSGTQAQKDAIAKICEPFAFCNSTHQNVRCLDTPNTDGTVNTMVTVVKAGEDNSLRVLTALKAQPDDSGSKDENPDDTSDAAGNSDNEAKGTGKRARSPDLDNACGGSSKKKARVITG
jgi:hypothetical protein